MSFLRRYSQFRGLTEEEVNAELRELAQERRRRDLARVEVLDLSRTTWPELPHPAIVAALTYVARRGLHRYADRTATELRGELARRHGVDPARVVAGDGAAQLIGAAVDALVQPGDELVTPWPSYGLYPLAARRAGAVAVPVPGFGAEPVLSAITPRTRVVCLCNPNDPTGELLDATAVRALAEELPERVVLLVDEALRDFATAEAADATLALLEDHPRVLLFRTFSKAWGLAGLRCGYAMGGAGSEELLERLAPHLGVDELAQAGCLEALRHHADLPARRRDRIAPLRERLLAEMASRGLHAPASQANVAWVRAPGPRGGAELAARLERAGIVVTPGAPSGAPEHVRITVPHEQGGIDRLVRALDAAS